MSNDEIIDIRDRLLALREERNLSVLENNILRDCDIALRVVRAAEETAAKARARLEKYRSEGSIPGVEPDSGWFRMDLAACDLCAEPAIWRHPDGGYRCGSCPRPR